MKTSTNLPVVHYNDTTDNTGVIAVQNPPERGENSHANARPFVLEVKNEIKRRLEGGTNPGRSYGRLFNMVGHAELRGREVSRWKLDSGKEACKDFYTCRGSC